MNDINISEILGIIFFLLITVTIIIRIISCDSNKGSHSSNHQKEKMEDNDIYLYVAVGIVIGWIIFK